MKIGILGGSGRMGSGLARGYVKLGHEVILGSRSAERAQSAAASIGGDATGGNLIDAARQAELIVLAVPFRDASATIESVRDDLDQKIIIDITNPFGAVPPGETSGIEETAKAAPEARWVAAYKTTFWKTLDEPVLPSGTRRDVFVASDDENAKADVLQLIEQTGFRGIDCGPLANARTLDLMVPLMLELDARYGLDAHSGWKFLDES